MKKTIILLSFMFIYFFSFSQPDYVKTFFNCGFPKLSDYQCFDYDTINIQKPFSLKISDNLNQKNIPKRFQRRMKIMRTASYIAIKNDEIIYENYWLGFNENSVLNSFSVSKSIVALLVGIAIDEGKLTSIDQYVSDILPWFNTSMDSTLKIKDLLSMSSGLSWDEEFANPKSDVAKAYYGDFLDSLIRNINVINRPGENWKYQCGNTLLLSLILEKVTNEPIHEYAQEKLWEPIGAEHVAYWGKSGENGMTKSFCCFYATPRDFAKLGLLILHKGKFNGKQIVSEKYINQIIQPSSWLEYKDKKVDFYGLHFWLVKHHNEYLPYFSGMLGQYIIIFPKENTVIVRFGEMINELGIESVPSDLKLYLKVADKLIKE